MWMLKNVNTGERCFIIKKKSIVGRSNGDIILPGDLSISRLHANIIINNEKLFLIDCSSKYGTFMNDDIVKLQKINSNIQIPLVEGDRIQFGRFENLWTVCNKRIQTITSALSDKYKIDLIDDIKSINGIISNSWNNECTHLTMSVVTITYKVLLSLVTGLPIVTPQYWKDLINSITNDQLVVNYKNYHPPIEDTYINKNDVNLTINKERKKLFTNKTIFFFLKKHLEKYEQVITLAGGKCICLSQTKITNSQLIKENTIVIQPYSSPESQSQLEINKVCDYMKEKGKRTIPDSEIGLAIIYCSTTKYCNPDYKFITNFKPINKTQEISATTILAENTPFINSNAIENSQKPIVIIEESENILEVENKTNDINSIIIDQQHIDKNSINLKRKSPFILDDDILVKRKMVEEVNIEDQDDIDDLIELNLTAQPQQRNSSVVVRSKRHFDDMNSDDLFAFDDNIKRTKRIKDKKPKDTIENITKSAANVSIAQVNSKPSKPVVAPAPKDNISLYSFKPVNLKSIDWCQKNTNKNRKTEILKDEKPNETKLWIESIKDVFQVKIKSMNYVKIENNNNLTSIIANNGGKNFKSFVKKMNFKPQTIVLKTIPVCVER